MALAVAGCGKARDEAPLDAAALSRDAASWLWSKQGPDGGWHSETHGLLRSGQALTPFVLATLFDASEGGAPPPAAAVEKALEFLRGRVGDDGAALGFADRDLLEYPNYATAYAIRCFAAAGNAADRARVEKMAAVLVARQYREENGFRPTDPAYGGWGFGASLPPGKSGHMDLAHTRRVLDALRAAGRLDPEVFARAQRFLRVVQNRAHPDRVPPREGFDDDGGFWFSPVVLEANKGLHDAPRFGSYATATCDGLLALLAAGVDPSDERVVAAKAWLARFPDPATPQGIPADQRIPWGPSLFHYHLAVRGEVARATGDAAAWREVAARILAPHRRPDGSFANANPLMKEDDPLIATALALTALR